MDNSCHKRKALGVCAKCGGERDSKLVLCSACRAQRNQKNATERQAKAAVGQCEWCNLPKTTTSRLCELHATAVALKKREYQRQLKFEALEAYGGAICVCCGELGIWFLTLDHVNNDGNIHRIDGYNATGYSALKVRGYPQEPALQVLCYNCNNGKRVNNGVCPHQENILWKEYAYEILDEDVVGSV